MQADKAVFSPEDLERLSNCYQRVVAELPNTEKPYVRLLVAGIVLRLGADRTLSEEELAESVLRNARLNLVWLPSPPWQGDDAPPSAALDSQ